MAYTIGRKNIRVAKHRCFLTKENVPIEAFQVEDALFIKVPRYLYKINLNNGNQEYQFDYRWGQVIR